MNHLRFYSPRPVRNQLRARRLLSERLDARQMLSVAPWDVSPRLEDDIPSIASERPAEGEDAAIVEVRLSARDLSGVALGSPTVQQGQAFQLVVTGKDLRPQPQGIFAIFNNLEFGPTSNVEVVVAETQRLRLSSNVSGGSFTLSLGGSTPAVINVPSGFIASEASSREALAAEIQRKLNDVLGPSSIAAFGDPAVNTTQGDILINIRGSYLGTNAPALVANFSGLSASSGSPSGSITDDYRTADPNNADAFNYSLIRFSNGIIPKGTYSTAQPNRITSIGGSVNFFSPPNPNETVPIYGVHFRALSTGSVSFGTSPGSNLPADDILVFPTLSVPPSQVIFGSLSVNIGQAGPAITDLGTVQGSFQLNNQAITTSGTEQIYKFTLASAGTSNNFAAINFQHATGDLDIELQDSSRTPLASSTSTSNEERVSLAGRPAGTYYVRVYGYLGATNSFGLSINAPVAQIQADALEPNNQSVNATNFGTVQGVFERNGLNLHTRGDVDYLRFTTTATGGSKDLVRIDFSHTQGDIDLLLMDTQGNVRTSASTLDFEEISLAGLAAGSYLIEVRGFQEATNPNYDLRIVAPQPQIPADTFEPNNAREQATVLDVPNGRASFDGLTIHNTTDQDWYRVTLPVRATADHKLTVAFAHATADLDIALFSSDGTRLRSSTGAQDTEEISLSGLEAGNYFLRVYSFLSVPSPAYSMRVALPVATIAPDTWEPNQTRETAADLRTVTNTLELLDLSIHNNTDNDWFRFETVARGTTSHFLGAVFSSGQETSIWRSTMPMEP